MGDQRANTRAIPSLLHGVERFTRWGRILNDPQWERRPLEPCPNDRGVKMFCYSAT